MKDISKSVLEKITVGHVTPKPRWQFLLHDWLIWAVFALSVVIGSLAFSVVIYYLVDFEWEAYERLNSTFWAFLFTSLPYLWMVIVALLLALAYHYFKHTKKGYRFGFTTVIVTSFLLSLLGGVILHAFNIGEYLDDLATQQVPFYPRMIRTPSQRWMNPEWGMIGGKVEELRDNGFLLRDFRGDIWTVLIREPIKMPKQQIQESMFVRIMGEKMGDNEFEARDIRLWLKKQFPIPFPPPLPKK